MGRKYTYQEVKGDFERVGYILLSTEYINSHAYLEYICPHHPEKPKKIRYGNFRRGQRCINCSSKKRGNSFRTSQEEAEKEFSKKGYRLIDKYDTNDKKMRFICSQHPDKETYMSLTNLLKGHECRYCAFEKLSGENSPNWKGGVSTIRRFFRDMIEEWRVQTLIKYDRRCFISGEYTKSLEVHHSIPFHKIRDIVLNRLKININEISIRGELTTIEQDLIKKEMQSIHRNICGFPIKRELHNLFHSLYGNDVNYGHLKEFKERWERGEFNNGLEAL